MTNSTFLSRQTFPSILLLFILISIVLTLYFIHRPQRFQQKADSSPCTYPLTFLDGNYLYESGSNLLYMSKKVCLYGATMYTSQGGTAPNTNWTNTNFTQRIDWDLALANQANLNILRVTDYLNSSSSNPYDPVVWANMDYLISQARAKGIFILMDLSTYANHLISQNINPYDPAQDPGWQQFISFVVNRYKNAPNISSYSIKGEVNPPPSGTFPVTTAQGYIDFYTRTTNGIYAIDPNHLIEAGGLTHLNNPSDGVPWQQIFSLPHVNIAAIHVYAANRLDPVNGSNDLHISLPMVATWAHQNNKPLDIQEFGIVNQIGDQVRASAIQTIDQAAMSNGYNSIIYWNLGPETTTGLHYDVNPSFPLAWQQFVTNAMVFYQSTGVLSPTPTNSITGTTGFPSPSVSITNSPTQPLIPSISSTFTPTPTFTTIPDAAPSGTISTSPTPTLSAPMGTLSLHFEGIDPINNPNPNHLQRNIVLSFYSSQDFTKTPVIKLPEIVTFDKTDPNGAFMNTAINLSILPTGDYYVLVKSPEGSLQEILNNSRPVQIVPGAQIYFSGTNKTIPVNLRMGDINNDNVVDLTDYNILIDCYGQKQTSPACKAHNLTDQTKGLFADMNDDGTVNGTDYNILLRNFGVSGY